MQQRLSITVLTGLSNTTSIELKTEEEVEKMASTDKKIVVITGCSSGIGLEAALLLAKESNYKVIATMRNLKKKENLEKAAGETLGKSLVIKELDVSKEDSILNFMKDTLESEGKIDVLINNAASGQFQAFETVTLKQMQSLFQTNVFGTMRLTQEAVRDMKKRKSGQIIFISSLGGFMPTMFCDFYIGTKFALEGFVGCLAPYLLQFNIRVSSIQPGPVTTAFIQNIDANNQGAIPGFSDAAKEQDVDPEIKALMDKYMVHMGGMITSQQQTGAEVAEVIKTCVQSEKPNVLMPTSAFVESSLKQILVDPSGNKMRDQISEMLK